MEERMSRRRLTVARMSMMICMVATRNRKKMKIAEEQE